MYCLDNIAKSPTFIASLSVELVLLALHASVLACIVKQRRKSSSSFRSGFFTIYVAQSLADICCFLLDLLLFRLAPLGCLIPGVFDFADGNIGFLLLAYVTNVLFSAHTAIGINRFLVLTDAWTKMKEHIAMVAILLLPIPTAALRIMGRTKLVETSASGTFAVVRDVPWTMGASTLLYHGATAIITMIFELRSLVRYRSLTAAAKAKYRNDYLLLIYALLQFSTQLVAIVAYEVFCVGTLVGDAKLASIALSVMTLNGTVLSLSPPLCLLSMSKLLRKAWFETYFPAKLVKRFMSSTAIARMTPTAWRSHEAH